MLEENKFYTIKSYDEPWLCLGIGKGIFGEYYRFIYPGEGYGKQWMTEANMHKDKIKEIGENKIEIIGDEWGAVYTRNHYDPTDWIKEFKKLRKVYDHALEKSVEAQK